MDAERREIKNGALLVRDGVIIWVGGSDSLPEHHAESVVSLQGRVVIPGLVNTHHHMFQSLTRVIAQDHELFGWLKSLYPIWQNIGAEHIYTASKLSMAELMRSGCTTSSDHTYIFPNGASLDDQIRAAQEIGMRFHAARGAMTLGESKGGLPPDSLVEDEAFVIKDTMRVIEAFHDANRHAMTRVVVAPCAPFNVSQDFMRESANLARSYGVRLHTHLAENANDIAYSLEMYGQRPGEYAESMGWLGDDVWHAHCVQLDGDEIRLFARTGTGVCHCPSSNMRLASGIAPIRAMLDAHVKVGLGVDGSASNDSGHLLSEARQAMLLQRVAHTNPGAMTAREALEVATLGGAKVLGRDDIGAIAVGMSADFACYRVDELSFAGAFADIVGALVFCQSVNADRLVINGRPIIVDGQFVTIDLPVLIEKHNALSMGLLNGV